MPAKPIVPEEPKPEVSKATLSAIGDVLIHSEVYEDARQQDGTYNFAPMFAGVADFMRKPDVLIANQETMIGGTKFGLSGYPMFNSPHEVGDALKAAGVDLVTVANNHTLDRGEKVIQSALAYWDAIGMPYTGAFKSQDDSARIRTMVSNRIVFSFLSYTYGTNGIPTPEGKAYLVNRLEEAKFAEDIEKAKQQSDVVVVAAHWGNEYEPMPSSAQQEQAQKFADLGADIVIGNHPHVLQPPAWVKGKNGRQTLVFYSLGNFISAQGGTARRAGGMATVDVVKTKTNGKTSIELKNPSFLPTYTYFRNMSDFQVVPMDRLSDGQLKNARGQYEAIKKHMSTFIPDLTFLPSK
ncbi:CapA family protein [Paenibacillus thalictri]|uniref:CapA family protein n=1 Tax=Paenibacillus thalictri TaxID=2527873 RepID=UPI0013EF1AC9|nr:CapA family protein [Paenibacillus thalictri]